VAGSDKVNVLVVVAGPEVESTCALGPSAQGLFLAEISMGRKR